MKKTLRILALILVCSLTFVFCSCETIVEIVEEKFADVVESIIDDRLDDILKDDETTKKSDETSKKTDDTTKKSDDTSKKDDDTSKKDDDTTKKPDEKPEPDDDNIVYGYSMRYSFDEDDEKELNDLFDDLVSFIAKASGSSRDERQLDDKFNDYVDAINALGDQYVLAMMDYYAKPDDKTCFGNYEYIDALYTEVMSDYDSLEAKIAESALSDYYFEGDDEYREAVLARAEFSDELLEIEKRLSELTLEYQTLDDSARNYDNKVTEIYLETIGLNNRKAKLYGYDNYLDYAYAEEYSRDYTPDDAKTVHSYVKEYIVPLLYDLYDVYDEGYYSYSETLINKMTAMLDDHFLDESSQKRIGAYVKAVGGDMPEAYDDLMSGRYLISYSEDSIATAFTTTLSDGPICYFAPEYYSSVSTFVHEFGHYYEDFVNEYSYALSYDLLETHSQANEWLFLAYISQDMTTPEAEWLAAYYGSDVLLSLVISTMVDEFEQYAYTHVGELTASNIDDRFEAIYDTYGIDDLYPYQYVADYWRAVVVDSACYYISYATSLVPVLQLYSTAKEDFDEAAEVYQALIDCGYGSFLDVTEDAGLYSPLDEEAYEVIARGF